MTNRSKTKGTAAESAVVRYIQEHGFPGAERRALAGGLDRADIAGVPHTVIEVKNCQRTELATWVDEMIRELINDGAEFGAVWHKRRGKGQPGDWFVTMNGELFVRLLQAALEGT